MPVNGPYDFRLAVKAVGGLISNENDIAVGEWAWIDRTTDFEDQGVPQTKRYLLIYARDPDCKTLCTVWRRFGDSGEPHGHQIDGHGNVTPSLLHNWPYGDPPSEKCGFHSYPTRLLGFVDLR